MRMLVKEYRQIKKIQVGSMVTMPFYIPDFLDYTHINHSSTDIFLI